MKETTEHYNQKTSSTVALIVGSLALFSDNLVVGLAVPVLPVLPSVVETGAARTGILFASYSISVVLAAVFAGKFVDKYGPKTPLLIGLVGLAVATLLFATGGPYILLLIARTAQGISGGMSWVAALSLIAATTDFDKRGQQMGIAISTITLGVLIGPPLAGFMVEHWGTSSPFLLAAVITAFDGVLRVLLVKGSPRVTDDVAGPTTVLRVPGSVSILLTIAVGAAAMAGIEPILALHLGASAFVMTSCDNWNYCQPNSGKPGHKSFSEDIYRCWRDHRHRRFADYRICRAFCSPKCNRNVPSRFIVSAFACSGNRIDQRARIPSYPSNFGRIIFSVHARLRWWIGYWPAFNRFCSAKNWFSNCAGYYRRNSRSHRGDFIILSS